MTTNRKVLVLNGPNLNLLGKREPDIYGHQTLADVVELLRADSQQHDIELTHLQSNSESELINAIHAAMGNTDFIIINAAAYTHSSIAIRDALVGVNIPFIEVHISNVYAREEFRHKSYLADVAIGVICGLGVDGYRFALSKAISLLSK